MIQNDLGIVGHSNQEISGLEEANKNARAYLQNFWRFLPLAGFLLINFCINTPRLFSAEGAVQRGVKIFYFSEEGLLLFLKVSPQQLHEVL